jgi:hypothetical protein
VLDVWNGGGHCSVYETGESCGKEYEEVHSECESETLRLELWIDCSRRMLSGKALGTCHFNG